MKRILLSTLFLTITVSVFGQIAPPADLATIQQSFKKLDVLGSVLYVAAHPDDENNRLLAYLAKGKLYRTGYLSLTRGDGGQNLLGDEQGSELGLIRTQELLAARRMDGAEQFFTRANDFGFSKNPEETLKIWDKEKVLSDVVWVIRKFRPDVIICRFPPDSRAGHGHHSASAILTHEAFIAAADPKRFPEQLKYLQVWQAKRLLWNTYSFGSINTTAPDQFKMDVGVFNPILGKGYGEIAAESRSNHKTQGFGTSKTRGEATEYFKTVLGDTPQTSLMDGVNTTWARVDAPQVGEELEKTRKDFDVDHPDKSVPALVKVLDRVEKIKDDYWREQKTKQLDELIASCAGLWFEAYAQKPAYSLGDSIAVNAQIVNWYSEKIDLQSLGTATYNDQNDFTINKNAFINKPFHLEKNNTQTFTIVAKKITQPYWLETPHGIGMYNIPEQRLVGNPVNPPYPAMIFSFSIEGKTIDFERPIEYKFTDPARGELYEPLVVAPPVTANITGKNYIFKTNEPQTVQIKLKSFTKTSGSISIKPVEGWKISPAKIDFSGKKAADEWMVDFTVSPTDSKPNTCVFKAEVNANGQTFSMGLRTIDYNHIPNITYFPPAEANLINIDLKTGGKNIGYIAGAGDMVPDALRQVGYNVHMLTENEIMNGDLSVYDAIITGVRAYNVNERLAFEQPRLLEYVKNGGDLVIQYNNNNGLVTHDIGPYPFRPDNQRVTDETAKVTVTDPQNAVLNYPNKINDADFDNWIQERGLYFVTDIDPKYATPFEMKDPGEAPKNGSLIVADYGKGRFVYTSLDFFRELPAGISGAYRLFINLLSPPKK